MHTIEDYRKAVRTIEDTKDAVLKIENTQDDKKKKLYEDYTKKIWALEDKVRHMKSEKEQKMEAVDQETKDIQQKFWSSVQACTDIRDRTLRLTDLFDYSVKGREVSWSKERYQRYHEPVWKEVPDIIICDGPYKKIGLFILKNDNKVNCYSLKLQIKSMFSEDSLRKHGDNNVPIWDTYELKTAPSEKSLLEWYEKNKGKLKIVRYNKSISLSSYIEFHEEIEKEYQEALKLFDDKNWRRIYWEYKKYYYEEHYSHGEDTDEYKGVLEALKICDTEDEDVPLLVGETKNEFGKYELRRRLG